MLDFLVNHVPINRLLLDFHFAKFGEKKVLVNANLTVISNSDKVVHVGQLHLD